MKVHIYADEGEPFAALKKSAAQLAAEGAHVDIVGYDNDDGDFSAIQLAFEASVFKSGSQALFLMTCPEADAA